MSKAEAVNANDFIFIVDIELVDFEVRRHYPYSKTATLSKVQSLNSGSRDFRHTRASRLQL
jgi:hypothetical protein